jgi:hypothetical protein
MFRIEKKRGAGIQKSAAGAVLTAPAALFNGC